MIDILMILQLLLYRVLLLYMNGYQKWKENVEISNILAIIFFIF